LQSADDNHNAATPNTGLGQRLDRFRRLTFGARNAAEEDLQRRTILARTTVGSWIALFAGPFAILTSVAALRPAALGAAGWLSAGFAVAVAFILLGIRLGAFRRHYSLPYFLLTGVVSNAGVAVVLHLTSGHDASPFFFTYFLLLLPAAGAFPASVRWMATTAAMTPLSFTAYCLWHNGTLTDRRAVIELVLLTTFALLCVVSNAVTSFLFFSEIERRLLAERTSRNLQELDRAKSEFFANVSHDLRSPLTAVLGPLTAVVNDQKSGLRAPHRSYLELALRGAVRVESMIDDLLELSRIDAGVGLLRPSRTDLVKLVQEQAQAFEPYASSQGLRIEFSAPAPSLMIDVDAGKIARVTMNLISNACKFSAPGGKVEVSVTETAEGARIVVRDRGVGIAPADHQRIFKRFERGTNAREYGIPGSGLGLAVIHEFVTLHGGRVEMDSKPGEGSTFSVILPRGKVPSDRPNGDSAGGEVHVLQSRPPPVLLAPTATPAPRRFSSGKPRIVVADSDAELLRYLQLELGEAYDVVEATDGEQALRVVASQPLDLVIAEAQLPKIDGIGLCRKIRADGTTAQVPFILFTTAAELEVLLEAYAAGADDVVRKPFEMLALWARIEALLRRARPPWLGGIHAAGPSS
jgi:signal transduction histidine kinase/CheY-like chemotaxis protein